MFQAKLSSSGIFKKIFEIAKDVVADCNISCEEDGIHMQSMDSTHSALLSLHLKPGFFRRYECDRAITLGLSLPSFFKILKAAKDDDKLTVKVVNEDPDALEVQWEGKRSSRISSYSLDLLTIEVEELDIPEQDYYAKIIMPSAELSAIVKDLMAVDDNVVIRVDKTGLRLEASGNQAKGEVWVKSDLPVKPVEGEDEDGDWDKTLVKEEEEEEEHKVKSRTKKRKVRFSLPRSLPHRQTSLQHFPPQKLQESTNTVPSSSPMAKRPKQELKRSFSENNEAASAEPQTIIQVTKTVSGLTYKLKHLQAITKCAALSERVELLIGPDSPLLVRFDLGEARGHIRYYVAPQIGDDA
ncbi:hypothetical protein V5O48_000082 [Marasmius crinis-equi]|uniref:DNA sliding clamp PCNA n=1 Tax=Marasmius crinis-equi TaxID=585013 RepID=A0ABR3G2I1_9AGAR